MPTLVTGAFQLLNDALTWILYLIPAASGAAIAYHALMKQMGDGDPSVTASHNRSIKNVLVGGAIGMSAASLVKVILAYFK